MTRNHSSRQVKTLRGQYAGFISRLLAFIIDLIIINFICLFTVWMISTVSLVIQGGSILHKLGETYGQINNFLTFLSSPLAYSIFYVSFFVGYHLFFWTIAGQTPGKAIIGVKIVPLKGGRLRLRHSIIRYIGYYISAFSFGLGFFWIIFDDRRMGWHDKLAKTHVIYVWDAMPDENFLVTSMERINKKREAVRSMLKKKPPGGSIK